MAETKKPKKVNYFKRKEIERKEKALGKRLIAEQRKRDLENPKTCPEGVYVSLQDINKIYDNGFHAVHDFSIDIQKHEFIVFVGPSGCGKSTTLRMIAGLEDISGGALFIDKDYMNDVAPKDRGIAMVFQSYALYPHMTVYDNMAYPLKIMHLSKKEINDRVMKAAKILQIEDLLDRKPKALSGGQRQRVALGRAIVRHAKVLLMDEPLSNLDAKLRVQMRSEIVKLHKRLNATTIYVTHDQTEAMTMATRIVIMKKGYVQQIGTPIEIFNHPVNKFVAGFIGSPSMNFFDAKYNNGVVTLVDGHQIQLSAEQIKLHDDYYAHRIEEDNDRVIELRDKIAAEHARIDADPVLKQDVETMTNKIVDLEKQMQDPATDEGTRIEIRSEIDKANAGLNKLCQNLFVMQAEEQQLVREMSQIQSINETHQHGVTLGIRPEDIHDAKPGDDSNFVFDVSVTLAELLGNEYYIHSDFGGKDMIARFPSAKQIMIGDQVTLFFDKEHLHLFSDQTERCIF